jgi:1,4-alpha-glucan branching enzyme/maltooligosyltrehalose trehalohydrolase
VDWQLGDGSNLRLLANFSDRIVRHPMPTGQMETVFASTADAAAGTLAPWDLVWTLESPASISLPAPEGAGQG